MFESVFNLKFNLVKAYTDIGLADDDAKLNALIYGLSDAEYAEAVAGFEAANRARAAEVLAAFEREHGAFAPRIEKPLRIAWLGDSITSDRESHQHIVRALLAGIPGLSFHDFSISGFKASDIFTNFYPGVADFCPDIAVLMIGTNDMRITDDEYHYYHGGIEEYARNMHYILARLAGLGCRTIVCTLPPFDMGKMREALEGWNILYEEEGRRAYDGAIADACSAHGGILVDMREAYGACDPAGITLDDGLHLNGDGHTLLASKIFPVLAGLLGHPLHG